MRVGSEVDFEPRLGVAEVRRSSQLPRTGSAYGAILSLSLYLSPLPLLFIDDCCGEHSGTAIRAREQNAKLYASKKQHLAICRAT